MFEINIVFKGNILSKFRNKLTNTSSYNNFTNKEDKLNIYSKNLRA